MYLEDLFTISANLRHPCNVNSSWFFEWYAYWSSTYRKFFTRVSNLASMFHHFQLETDWHKMTPEGNMQ